MVTTTVIMGMVIIGMMLLILALSLKVEYLKIYKNGYDAMEQNADKAIENAKNLAKICDDLIRDAQYDQKKREHYLIILRAMQDGLKYANVFLKPRKRKEMWHRATNFPTWEEFNDKGTLLSTSDTER